MKDEEKAGEVHKEAEADIIAWEEEKAEAGIEKSTGLPKYKVKNKWKTTCREMKEDDGEEVSESGRLSGGEEEHPASPCACRCRTASDVRDSTSGSAAAWPPYSTSRYSPASKASRSDAGVSG